MNYISIGIIILAAFIASVTSRYCEGKQDRISERKALNPIFLKREPRVWAEYL